MRCSLFTTEDLLVHHAQVAPSVAGPFFRLHTRVCWVLTRKKWSPSCKRLVQQRILHWLYLSCLRQRAALRVRTYVCTRTPTPHARQASRLQLLTLLSPLSRAFIFFTLFFARALTSARCGLACSVNTTLYCTVLVPSTQLVHSYLEYNTDVCTFLVLHRGCTSFLGVCWPGCVRVLQQQTAVGDIRTHL